MLIPADANDSNEKASFAAIAKQPLNTLWSVNFVQTELGDECVGTEFLEIKHAVRAFLEGANAYAAALQQRRLESSEKTKAKTNKPPTRTESRINRTGLTIFWRKSSLSIPMANSKVGD